MALPLVNNVIEIYAMAKIKALSQDIEEEVTLGVDGFTFVGFAFNRPTIEEGDIRKVQLKLFTASDYDLTEVSQDEAPSVTRIGNGFGYHIIGTMVGEGVSLGAVTFLEQSFAMDYSYLMNMRISLMVDRIDIRFVKD